MNISISEKSKQAYEEACKKLGISSVLPDFSVLRPDMALYMTAKLMLITIIEAGKDGKIHDITDHSHFKYENIFMASNGHKPGSAGGGFSSDDYVFDDDYSTVGARLSFNSRQEGETCADEYPELWEIIMLDVR